MRTTISALFFSIFSMGAVSAEVVTFAGSSTVMPIIEAMEPVFSEHEIEIQVQGGGSSAGLKATKAGLAQIGMISRSLSEKEAQIFKKLTISKDWVVMISHSDLPIDDITSQQVVDIFSGTKAEIDGNRINPIAKEGGRATKKVFDKYFDLKGKLDPKLVIIGANGQAIASVANDPFGMAYISYSAAIRAVEQGEPIKILTLDGVAGTPENVKSDTYKLSRALNLVYMEKDADLIERIRTVLATPEAEKVFTASNVMSAL